MKKLFCRIGSKTYIADKIIQLFTLEHDIYVEPFVGGAGVYFKKPPSKKEILNDIDKDLINSYKLVMKVKQPSKEEAEAYDKYLKDNETLTKFYQSKGGSNLDKLVKAIVKYCFTYSSRGVGKTNTPQSMNKTGKLSTKLKYIEKYQERFKNTKFYSMDYKKMIEKYDSSKTLFYLDPPYENTDKTLYNNTEIDYEEMKNILKKIKGKFVLSINKSKNIIEIFKDFNMKQITVKTHSGGSMIGKKQRQELLIYNF